MTHPLKCHCYQSINQTQLTYETRENRERIDPIWKPVFQAGSVHVFWGERMIQEFFSHTNPIKCHCHQFNGNPPEIRRADTENKPKPAAPLNRPENFDPKHVVSRYPVCPKSISCVLGVYKPAEIRGISIGIPKFFQLFHPHFSRKTLCVWWFHEFHPRENGPQKLSHLCVDVADVAELLSAVWCGRIESARGPLKRRRQRRIEMCVCVFFMREWVKGLL